MKYPKLRELKEAVTALIKGPYTTKFPFEPHKPPERFRGKPVPDDDWCIGCKACAEVCPSGAIEVIDVPEAGTRRIIRHYDKCIFCGQCELNCTTEKGVHLGEEYDLAAFDRETLSGEQMMELLLCDKCGRVIGTKKHLLWLVRKLGPLAYGNFPLVLIAQRELGIAQEESPSNKVPPTKPAPSSRSDNFRILCPRCRHEIVLRDQYGKSLQ